MQSNQQTEIWKDVVGYEGHYQVSNLGRIRSLFFNKSARDDPYIMNPHIQKNGYVYVRLYKNKSYRSVRLHRIVATAFIPNPNNYPIINHIDEDKANNMVENLEWCTHKYNSNYGNRIEKTISPQRKPIGKYDLNGNLIKVYRGVNEAARVENLSAGNICMTCKGKRLMAGGYEWRYMDE